MILMLSESCYKEEVIFNSEPDSLLELPLILRINEKDCALDYNTGSLRYSISEDKIPGFEALIEFQDYSVIYFEDQLLVNNKINNLGEIEINTPYKVTVITNNLVTELILTFSNLPIIQIVLADKIFDDPKSLAKVSVNYPDRKTITSFIGIEQRGGWHTLQLAKKSYNFIFLNSSYIDDKVPTSLFNLEKNTEWMLDGMFADDMRARNKIASQIWLTISDDSHFGIQLNYVELFINNQHQGLYCLGPKINDELIGLSNNNALLYKAIGWTGPGCFVESSSNISTIDIWDGWVQKYPPPAQRINWVPLADLRNLVIDGSDQEFHSRIDMLIDINNFIDYYLFLNLICATDNLNKNIYLTRASLAKPLCVIPWDYERSFSSSSIISNNPLYQRLLLLDPANFRQRLKDRWFYLRNNSFSLDNLESVIRKNFDEINKSNIINIENNKWGSSIYTDCENIISWVSARSNTLDEYYSDL